jgi:hypothetical protein
MYFNSLEIRFLDHMKLEFDRAFDKLGPFPPRGPVSNLVSGKDSVFYL